ncbi:uncharacterized protein LOC131955705 [Physella acuta]|uniref:uncharacterized protein LOC131955705 n=1 Tax=Physella acuta TaxID=109671 RepID=UPI0027DD15B7|nr:uncharacterized protein LOC131955705 [Physella acuta]
MTIFYKFNSISQNLNAASQDVSTGQPITPQFFSEKQAPTQLSKVFYDFKTDLQPTRAQSSVSNLRPGEYPVPSTKNYKTFMERQTKFLISDGKLVWQKLPVDKPLYFTAAALVLVATAWTAWSLKTFASPPKN